MSSADTASTIEVSAFLMSMVVSILRRIPVTEITSIWSVLFFVSLALGLFISTVAEKQIVALLISGAGLMLPVVYLSGMMFPLESMPVALQWFANIIPAKWFIIAMRNVMIKGLGITSVLREIIILVGMGSLIVFASIKRFKIRLE